MTRSSQDIIKIPEKVFYVILQREYAQIAFKNEFLKKLKKMGHEGQKS
jgi:hypothetical protein